MDINSFSNLRDQCFELVKQDLKKRYDKDTLDVLISLVLQHRLLRATELVVETYKGIIGYHNWLVLESIEPTHFIQDALHDLNEAVRYRREDDGYCPRTSQYVDFYHE